MADMETDQPIVAVEKQPLEFDDYFNTRHPGDVILQAGDNEAICFYFRLSLLAELSSFFASLPPASSGDLTDGTPLIPLHGSTSEGLSVYLSAIRSISSVNPYDFVNAMEGWDAILQAAVLAKMFDTPLVIRILYESIRDYHHPRIPYIAFAILAIGDVTAKLPQAAVATLKPGRTKISLVETFIVTSCRGHALAHWSRLQDLHLRHTEALGELYTRLNNPVNNYIQSFGYHTIPQFAGRACAEAPANAAKIARSWFDPARTVEEVAGQMKGDYGLSCEVCKIEARERYGDLIKWFAGFALEYDYEPENW